MALFLALVPLPVPVPVAMAAVVEEDIAGRRRTSHRKGACCLQDGVGLIAAMGGVRRW